MWGRQMLVSSMIVATVPVTDLDRAKHFYADTLGLKVLWENPASVRLGCGGGTELSIFRRAPSTADHTLAHFEVADIEAVVGELEKREVKFIDYGEGPLQTTGHIAQIGPARGAWLRDPDGNILGLRQAP
ncbi:MAG: VOC family protein [Chloroflexi bacterium]|nr:MAG: VOC family protein [Chloroflexota bacterium]